MIKAAITLAVILLCTAVGKKLPSLAGLMAVMPLSGSLVLICWGGSWVGPNAVNLVISS